MLPSFFRCSQRPPLKRWIRTLQTCNFAFHSIQKRKRPPSSPAPHQRIITSTQPFQYQSVRARHSNSFSRNSGFEREIILPDTPEGKEAYAKVRSVWLRAANKVLKHGQVERLW